MQNQKKCVHLQCRNFMRAKYKRLSIHIGGYFYSR
nr:MAG TPA: hypothetical protein [Caudoviricetes sp.]